VSRTGRVDGEFARVDNRAVLKSPPLLPVLALVFNALVWGASWWPFRQLEAHGLHPLWATALVFLLAVVAIGVVRPRAFVQVATMPTLWILMLAAGCTNAAFNWGVVVGDVVRVVLLFYLMPLWTVLLARFILHEALTPSAGIRVVCAIAGAAIVLWPEGRGLSMDTLPMPRALPDWLGLAGGFSFSLNNVMLRREAARPEEGRALAMFLGGALVSAALASVLSSKGLAPWPPPLSGAWAVIALVLAGLFIFSNLSLQFGAARLPANVTSVVMLCEVVFASASAIALGAGQMTAPLAMGGGLIIGAALLAASGSSHS